jgi:hypothetical protein
MLLAEGVDPQSEKDVRDVAHKYLEVYFTQYTRDSPDSWPDTTVQPDAGIINLKVAIEFKFTPRPGHPPSVLLKETSVQISRSYIA